MILVILSHPFMNTTVVLGFYLCPLAVCYSFHIKILHILFIYYCLSYDCCWYSKVTFKITFLYAKAQKCRFISNVDFVSSKLLFNTLMSSVMCIFSTILYMET